MSVFGLYGDSTHRSMSSIPPRMISNDSNNRSSVYVNGSFHGR